MKDISYKIDLREMVNADTAARESIRRGKMLRLWEEGGQTMIWCDQCQRYEPISKEDLKMVKASRICPMCFRECEGTTKKEIHGARLFAEYEDGKGYGYELPIHWSKGKITTGYPNQTAYWVGNKEYVNGIVSNMGYSIAHSKPYWREVKRSYYGYQVYLGFFFVADGICPDTDWKIWELFVYSRRSYYEYITQDIELKSNQVKLISEGIYSLEQIKFIKAFDLKNRKDVLKYSGYIKQNYCDGTENYNITTLDYLWRNKIRLSDYNDYVRCCKVIGRKPDKPKDFKHWHDEVTMASKVKENEVMSIAMDGRSKALIGYEKKDVVIQPVHSFKDLMEISKTLHNCIRTYAEKYAKGQCDLYYVTQEGTIVGAIEVRNRKLVQARGDNNTNLDSNIMRVVNEWCLRIGVA